MDAAAYNDEEIQHAWRMDMPCLQHMHTPLRPMGQRPSWHLQGIDTHTIAGMADYEIKVHDLKDSLFSQALDGLQEPQVVDVGIGSGPNLQYLAKYKVGTHRWTALYRLRTGGGEMAT